MKTEMPNATNEQFEVVDLPNFEGVCFDPDSTTLIGLYRDELAAHRARKQWINTLSKSFLLDRERDFDCEIIPELDRLRFVLRCVFTSACGRYAFWRVTNDQAPEAQYEIETAHIPNSVSRHSDFVAAPDLRSISPEPMVISNWSSSEADPFSGWLKQIISKLTRKVSI